MMSLKKFWLDFIFGLLNQLTKKKPHKRQQVHKQNFEWDVVLA